LSKDVSFVKRDDLFEISVVRHVSLTSHTRVVDVSFVKRDDLFEISVVRHVSLTSHTFFGLCLTKEIISSTTLLTKESSKTKESSTSLLSKETISLTSLLTKEKQKSRRKDDLFDDSFDKRDHLFDDSFDKRDVKKIVSFDKRDVDDSFVFDDSFAERDVKEIVFSTTLLLLCQKTCVCVSRTLFGLF